MDAGDLRRVTWVCGDQRVLIEEVVDTTRAKLGAADIDYVSINDSPTMDQQVWAAANQYPLNPGASRLVLVRDAEKLTRLDPLDQWMSRTRQLPGVYLLFVSNELEPPPAAVKSPRGHIVRCVMPSDPDAVAWVRRRSRMDEDTARFLLTRTGGNLAEVAAVCAKLALFDGAASKATIAAMCAERPASSFVDCLLTLDKRGALTSISGLVEAEYGKIISLLDSRLDTLLALHRTQAAGQGFYRDGTGVNPYLVRQYLPIARHYDQKRCVYRRRVLAVVDDAIRSGARDGVWEALVALW